MTKARDVATQGGLVLLTPGSANNGTIGASGGITFTTASSVSLNNVFTSAYDNYKIICRVRGSADATLNMRLRTNGTDNTNSNYQSSGIRAASSQNTTDVPIFGNSGSLFEVCIIAANDCLVDLTVLGPQLAADTRMSGVHGSVKAGVSINAVMTTAHNFGVSTQFDGLTIFPNTGTITGTIRIYGIRN